MAKVVKEIPRGTGGPGSTEKYPWDKWFDGRLWELCAGDFDVAPRMFSQSVRAAAKRRGLSVTCACRGDKVYVQAHRD